jgi:hypothetical protein
VKLENKEDFLKVFNAEPCLFDGKHKGFDYYLERHTTLLTWTAFIFIEDKMNRVKEWETKIDPHGGINWIDSFHGHHAIAFDFARVDDFIPLDLILLGSDVTFDKPYWTLKEVKAETERVITQLDGLRNPLKKLFKVK